MGHREGRRKGWMKREALCPTVAHLWPVSGPDATPLPPGSQASESLLTRARCYALLGQRKTALFDFNSVLRAEPGHVQALCGRALLHLALDQQQVQPHPHLGLGKCSGGQDALGELLPSPSAPREEQE